MCIVSNAFDGFSPIIPTPTPWPVPCTGIPNPGLAPWGPVPNTGQILNPDQLKELLEAFHAAVAAAKKADAAAGQPDCQDPEKAKIEERVAELERRLALLEAVKPKTKPRKRAKKAAK